MEKKLIYIVSVNKDGFERIDRVYNKFKDAEKRVDELKKEKGEEGLYFITPRVLR